MSKELKYNCVFCNKETNFKDNDKAYCVDCYVKIRNSAHTHLPVNPWPINPMPTIPFTPNPPNPIDPLYPNGPIFIC